MEEAEVIEFPKREDFALSLSDFFDAVSEKPDWLVDGLIPAQSLTILAAKPKVGKSLLTFNLALALANKDKFLNRETTKCNVLIVQLEDPAFLIRERLETMGADVSDKIYIRCQQTLTSADFEALKEFIMEYAIGLTIIDPLIFAMRGNEQDASQTATFLREVRELIFATKSAVLLVHHHRKSGGEHGDEMRGSSAILGAVDVAFNLHREDEAATATLKVTSRFASVENEVMTLDTDTLTWRSAGSASEYKKGKRENEILEALEGHSILTVIELEEAIALSAPNFRRELKGLVSQGLVNETKVGTNGRPRFSYSLTPEYFSMSNHATNKLLDASIVEKFNYDDQGKQPPNTLYDDNSYPIDKDNRRKGITCDMCGKPTTTRKNLNGKWICLECFEASKVIQFPTKEGVAQCELM